MTMESLIQQLAEKFSDRQLFLVGGCLRDQLLGRQISDLDLATDVPPEEVYQRVKDWADAVWLVGEKFGTVGLMKDGIKAEITTFRAERYDGVSRKPEVVFGAEIEADLARRDFTINAMARNLHTGELIDPSQGQRDLEEEIVCFVGEPETRIMEDPLRMMRAVRFCAQLGFELDPAAAIAIAGAAKELHRISWERIRDELDGIMLSPHPKEGLQLLLDLGLVDYVLPELRKLHLPEPACHYMKDILEHTLDAVSQTPAEKELRYAALLHDFAKPDTVASDESGVHFYTHEKLGSERAHAILTRLRQPAQFIERVTSLIRYHLRVPYYSSEWSLSAVRRLMFDLGDQLQDAIALAEADVRASDPSDYPEFQQRLQELRDRIEEVGEAAELARLKPLLNGEEVMSLLGIGPGPLVGEALDFLLDRQVEGEIETKEEAIAAILQKFSGK